MYTIKIVPTDTLHLVEGAIRIEQLSLASKSGVAQIIGGEVVLRPGTSLTIRHGHDGYVHLELSAEPELARDGE